MIPFIITDSWEGMPFLDLGIMSVGGVVGNNPRLNALIPYGHRKDYLFDSQWAAQVAFGFIGAPYFVPNNYISAKANFDWLVANMPLNAGAVLFDIELTRQDWTPLQYSQFVSDLYKLCVTRWNIAPYTGEWFVQYLSPWLDLPTWWAEYIYSLAPAPVESWSWEKFVSVANTFSGPLNASKIPSGKLFMWQCSGSTAPTATRPTGGLILPGSSKIMDVSLCFWSQSELENFYKQKIGVPVIVPTPQPTPTPEPIPAPILGLSVKTTVNLNLRQSPNSTSSIVFTEPLGSVLTSLEYDSDTQSKVGKTGLWLNVKDSMNRVGYVSSYFLEFPNIISKSIQQPAYLLSDAELGISWESRFPDSKLSAYPATINLENGKGVVHLAPSYLTQLQRIMTPIQYAETWKNEQGWHNKPHGEIGTVQQVTFVHSYVWIVGEDNNYYYIDTYYNDEVCPDLVSNYDQYRINIFSVMDNKGNIFYSDKGLLKTLNIANSRTEKLKIEKKYCKPLFTFPVSAKVKTNGSRLNVRNSPTGTVITSLADTTSVTIIEFNKISNKIWGNIGIGWIRLDFTDLDI